MPSRLIAFQGIILGTLLFLLGTAGLPTASAQTVTFQLDSTQVEARVIRNDLYVPWDLWWGPDGWIWFSSRDGYIQRMRPDGSELDTLHIITDVFVSEDNAGVHGMAIHPNFADTPYFFVQYNYELNRNRIKRYTYNSFLGSVTDSLTVLDGNPGNNSHNGCRMVITPDLKLIATLGDAFDESLPQSFDTYAGKIIRMNLDGSIPADNPFGNNLAYSIGHRNPQGLVLLQNGRLFSSEHGTNKDDEFNEIFAGRNYGWPQVEGFCDEPDEQQFCQDSNVVEPLVAWTPAEAPCGVAYYDHPAIPEWRGSFLQAFLKARRLRVLHMNTALDSVVESNDYLIEDYGRMRDVLVAPDGRVFISISTKWPADTAREDMIIELRNPAFVSTPEPRQPEAQLSLYPNPATHQLHLHYPDSWQAEALHIRGVDGRRYPMPAPAFQTGRAALSVAHLAPGVYFVTLQLRNGRRIVKKFVRVE